MKRYGNLYSQIVEFDNLFLAARKAQSGKRFRDNVIDFNRRFKSEVHHLKSLTEESSSVKVGYCSKQTDKLMNYSHLS
ncbi:MAG: hypothetical protein RLZZ580_2052, partial [Cyanobacteriota bacterium]